MRLLDAVVASPGAPHGQAGGHPRRRGGPAGGPPCRRIGPGPGQAARAPHPAPAAAAGEHRAPVQSNRRLSVSRRAVNPAASRRCLVVRSPGSASASTSAQPRPVHQSTAASMQRRARRPRRGRPSPRSSTRPGRSGHVRGPCGRGRRPGGRPRPPRTPPPRGGRRPRAGSSVRAGVTGRGVSDQRGATPHGRRGHQGLGEQARAGLAVRRSGRPGQLHRR